MREFANRTRPICDLSVESVIRKLGAYDWRTRACLTAESNLVRLGRLPVCHRAGFDLVLVSQANRAAAFYSGLSCRDISANDLAGALELLFHGCLHHRPAGSACADPIARGGVDRLCLVDVTGCSVLGRADLA